MSRGIHGRWRLRGDLVAGTALHVGSVGDGDAVDLIVQRDGRGRVLLPGTTLAGALRAALDKWHLVDPGTVPAALAGDAWWGYAEPGQDIGHASFVLVDDAAAHHSVDTVVREHVALDRRHGAAADNRLYSREVVPPGTTFGFELTVEVPAAGDRPADTAKALFDRLVQLLTTSGLCIGSGQSRGLGRIFLSTGRTWHEDWATPEGMIDLLTGKPTTTVRAAAGLLRPDPWAVRITVPWTPVGGVLSTTAVAAALVDDVPVTTPDADGTLRLVLAGSGIKGALGSHLERIARTLAGVDVPDTGFDDQIDQRQTLPGVHALLGLPGSDQHPTPGDEPRPAGRAGALTFSDVLGRDRIDPARWAAALADLPDTTPAAGRTWAQAVDAAHPANQADQRLADDQAFTRLLDDLDPHEEPDTDRPHPLMIPAPHVAIDRWTGGAAASRLFQVLEPSRGVTFHPLTITVDIALWQQPDPTRDTPGDPTDRAAGWLLLLVALRDFCAGYVPLGSQTTRGLGAVRADPAAVTLEAGSGIRPDTLDGRIAAAATLAAVIADPADLAGTDLAVVTAELETGLRRAYPMLAVPA